MPKFLSHTVTIKIGDEDVLCEVKGPVDGPTILHTGGIVFPELMLAMADMLGARVVVPRFPYWQATETKLPTVEEMLGHLEAVLDNAVLFPKDSAPPYLAGASLPGWLAMLLAARCEAKGQVLSGLLLTATPAPYYGADEEAASSIDAEVDSVSGKAIINPMRLFALRNARNTKFCTANSEPARLSFLNDPATDRHTKAMIERAEPERKAVEGYRWSTRNISWPSVVPAADAELWAKSRISPAFLNHFFAELWSRASDIPLPNIPIKIILGLEDRTNPVTLWPEYLAAKGNPENCDYVILPGAGHFPMCKENKILAARPESLCTIASRESAVSIMEDDEIIFEPSVAYGELEIIDAATNVLASALLEKIRAEDRLEYTGVKDESGESRGSETGDGFKTILTGSEAYIQAAKAFMGAYEHVSPSLGLRL